MLSAESASAVAVPAGVRASSTAPAQTAPCNDAGDVFVFASPERPVKGRPMRVVAVADRAIEGELALQSPAGERAAVTRDRGGGPPYFWVAQVEAPGEGKWRASLACGSGEVAHEEIAVGARGFAAQTPRTAVWLSRRAWSPSFDNLYSAWIEHLFDAPLDAQPSWNALHEVLRDRSRNFLHDHLGSEDDQGVVVRPDCADLPYFLRAYFAFKLGLPFGWQTCSRGELGQAPSCADFATHADPFPEKADAGPQTLPPWADPKREAGPWDSSIRRLGEFFRTTLADAVQSGAGRVPAESDDTDYYPVALSAETLRPGVVFADPYGHVLVVVKRVAQSSDRGGILLAIDGQPDGTVARKRFWRGNFLFAIEPALGSAGFKRFRPVLRDGATGKWREAKNAELPDLSLDAYANGVEGFYDKMDDVLSPSPLDPTQALVETLQALEEQVRTRVVSVDNGRKFLASGKPAASMPSAPHTIEMPEGAKIFETTGDWEDFSTPSRDLRLLIAIDVARALPARVARRPERYAMPAGKTVEEVRADLEARLASELRSRSFKYTRTDGSDWELSLQIVVDRAASLEVAYDPNDCVELRWGAPEGSDEAKTCVHRAPEAQRAKMGQYRAWFHERRRPPR